MALIRILLLLLFLPAASVGQAAEVKILFIGNSLTYWNDLPAIVEAMANAGDQPPVEIKTVAFPDFSLEDHWNRGDAVRMLEQQTWDFVVLQQGPSASEEGRNLLLRDSEAFAAEIRKSKAKPVLYSVWPSRQRKFDFERSIESYKLAASKVNGVLAPAGRAWLEAWKLDPSLILYESDGLHPAKNGSFLAALVLYEVLFGDCRKLPLKIIEIDPNTAQILKQAAHQAVSLK